MEHLGKLQMPNMGKAMGQLFPLLGLITVIKQTMPPEGHQALQYCQKFLRGVLNPFCFYNVPEFEGSLPNDLYRDIQLHLESCKAFSKATRVSLFRQPNTTAMTTRLSSSHDVIVDTYKGMTVWWTHTQAQKDKFVYRGPYASGGEAKREYSLKIRKKDKARLIPEYLEFLSKNASTYSGKTREIKIYTNSEDRGFHHYTDSGSRRMWEALPYKHPSTFETLALDPHLKETIIADLLSFQNDKDFYQKTGRAWKRGYLLYGPPGTGKSSMVAAMANFLKYDIYDLELTQVRTNGELRQLLVQTTNRSIIVLEDIDCSVNFTGSRTSGKRRVGPPMLTPDLELMEREDPKKVTLSGLLNFVDGLWSCCGDERIFVFTTNHVEKLDAALLRPGRMDMQIEMSYCTFPAFKVLAHNYLSIDDNPLFDKVKESFVGKTMTPAQIAETLVQNKDDVEAALEAVIQALNNSIPERPSTPSVEVTQTETQEKSTSGEKGSSVDVPGSDRALIIGNKEDVISSLEGVIQALKEDVPGVSGALSNSSSQKSEELQTKSNYKVSPANGPVDSNTKELVNTLRLSLLKTKGDIDSAIEDIIQALEKDLSNSNSDGISMEMNGTGSILQKDSNGLSLSISNGMSDEREILEI